MGYFVMNVLAHIDLKIDKMVYFLIKTCFAYFPLPVPITIEKQLVPLTFKESIKMENIGAA